MLDILRQMRDCASGKFVFKKKETFGRVFNNNHIQEVIFSTLFGGREKGGGISKYK
jgi:hypothetical protein